MIFDYLKMQYDFLKNFYIHQSKKNPYKILLVQNKRWKYVEMYGNLKCVMENKTGKKIICIFLGQ